MYRIMNPQGKTAVECDTAQEVMALTKAMNITLVQPWPFPTSAKPAKPAKTPDGQDWPFPTSARPEKAPAKVEGKPKVARNSHIAQRVLPADFEFLNTMKKRRSHTVTGFTEKQVRAALERNNGKTGFTFEFDPKDDGSIVVKRTS